jgi:hypothetical protein
MNSAATKYGNQASGLNPTASANGVIRRKYVEIESVSQFVR